MAGERAPATTEARTRGRWPAGLVGMLVVVAAFEAYLAAHPADFAELSASDWRLTRRAASAEARGAEILCLGDSLLKFGLVPELIEKRTGLATFNLSILGGQSATSYFLLRRALDAGASPKAIVLDCQDLPSKSYLPGIRGLGLSAHVRSWPELLSVSEAADLAWSARDATLFAMVVARKALPSFKARREVRSNLGSLVRKGDSSSRRWYLAQERNWTLNRGSLLMSRKPKNPTAIGQEPRLDHDSLWCPDSVTTVYLRKLLALAEGRGIRVFWLIPPTSPEHEGLRAATGQHVYYTKLAEALRDEFPALSVIDGRAPGYGRGVFIDDSHLDRGGATAFTSDVAEAIADGMNPANPGARWVALPPFKERGTPGGVEDMDQSRLALGPRRGGDRR